MLCVHVSGWETQEFPRNTERAAGDGRDADAQMYCSQGTCDVYVRWCATQQSKRSTHSNYKKIGLHASACSHTGMLTCHVHCSHASIECARVNLTLPDHVRGYNALTLKHEQVQRNHSRCTTSTLSVKQCKVEMHDIMCWCGWCMRALWLLSGLGFSRALRCCVFASR